MVKLIFMSVCASIAIACVSPPSNIKSNVATNQGNSNAVNRNANAETFNTLGLNENAYTTASNSSLGKLKPSVGKYASEIKLWQDKEIDNRLNKLMGRDYAIMKKFWNSETPIRKFGDVLMMSGCERNNCIANQYVIFMDTAEGNINVVHIGKDATKDWKESGSIDLPPPFAEELSAMKSQL